jgi:CRP-like cAMP-binding protein
MNDSLLALKQADIFFQISPAQLEKIAEICIVQSYDTGEIILEEGANSDDLYVIAQGEVDVLIDPALVSIPGERGLASVTIATLRRGQSFGEIALVDRGMRSATVRAAQQKTHLLMIPSKKLLDLCEADLSLGYRLMYNLAADLAMKMRNADLRLRESLFYYPGPLQKL